jgi:hypothetical protein
MRAQSVRKTIGILNVVVVLGIAGAAVWYVTKVKPALAGGVKAKAWLDTSYKEYEVAKRNTAPAEIYPLTEAELEQIRRRDLQTEAGVWSYVGPVPVPLPKKETVKANEPPPPEGLDALGKLYTAIVGGGERPSTIAWRFNSNKIGYFGEGEFVVENEKTDKKRFKLIDVLQPDRSKEIVTLVYDVYDDPAKDPVEKGKKGGPYDLSRKVDPKKQHIVESRPAGTGGPAATAAAGGPAGAAGTAPTPTPVVGPAGVSAVPVRVEDLKPVIRRQGNDTYIEFDEAAYEGYRNVTVEEVLTKVRTEDVVDSRTGQRTGVRIADTGGVAASFDVQRGDILKSINGVRVTSRDEAVRVVKGLPKETTTVSVVIERNGIDRSYVVDPRDPKVRAAANRLKVGGGK